MFERLTWCRGVETVEGWVRWLKAVCAPLRKPGPMSLSRVPQTLANRLAADPLVCGVLASLHLHLKHKVDRERVVETG